MNTTTALRATAVTLTVAYFGALFTAPLPEGAYDDARVVGLLSGGDLASIVVGGCFLVAAGIAALVFTSLLTSTLRRTGHGDTGTAVVRSLGSAYALMLMVAAVLFLSVPMGHVVEELPEATPSPFRELTMAGFTALLIPALFCAGLMVLVVSVMLRRSGLAPRWCTMTGFVIAPVLFFGIGWAPQFLMPVWTLVVAFGIRRVAPTDASPEARQLAVR